MSRVSDLDRQISRNVRSLREAAKTTQAQVARFLGVSYQSYQKIEGGRSVFRADLLVKLAGLFGVTVELLLSGDVEQLLLRAYPPLVSRILVMLCEMTDAQRDQALAATISIKNSGAQL